MGRITTDGQDGEGGPEERRARRPSYEDRGLVMQMKLTVLGMIFMSIATMAFGQAGFKDLGIGAPVSESRGFVALQDGQGRNVGIVLATDRSPRGYFLVVDLDSGQTEQVWFPEVS